MTEQNPAEVTLADLDLENPAPAAEENVPEQEPEAQPDTAAVEDVPEQEPVIEGERGGGKTDALLADFAAAAEPEVVAPEPEVAAPEPEVAAPEPEVAAPEVAAPEPEVVSEPEHAPAHLHQHGRHGHRIDPNNSATWPIGSRPTAN